MIKSRSIFARRLASQADEAISILDVGDCFALFEGSQNG
jgi:hypothetical protein